MAAGHTNWLNFLYDYTESWADEWNILDDDSDFAYCTAVGNYIDLWGLDGANIPYGAQISGIEIRARLGHNTECTASGKTMFVKCSMDGSNFFYADAGTGNGNFTITSTMTNYDLGGTGDRWNPLTSSLSPSFKYPVWSPHVFNVADASPVAPFFCVRVQAASLKSPACQTGYAFTFKAEYVGARIHWYYPEERGPLSQLISRKP